MTEYILECEECGIEEYLYSDILEDMGNFNTYEHDENMGMCVICGKGDMFITKINKEGQ